MIKLRKAGERGHTKLDWLDSWHSFSFGDYYDPAHMGFSVLRVFNDDRVAPEAGFDMHPHRDMEILTYVLEGSLEHQDSLGNGSVIRPGDVQRMSAGTGILHSEFNPSSTKPVHFLQIWIMPSAKDLQPAYAQKTFLGASKRNQWCLAASPDGRDDSIAINQDAALYLTLLEPGHRLNYDLAPGRHAWIHLARGQARANEVTLQTGDAAGVTQGQALEFEAEETAEILLFDLP